MRRIRLDKLQRAGRRLTLDGIPFSGIGYDVKTGLVRANYRIDDGIVGGPHELWGPEFTRVTLEALTERKPTEAERYPEPGLQHVTVLCLDGRPFTGIIYDFDEAGWLLKEEINDRSMPVASREWYPSGQLRIDDGYTTRDAYYSWHENGQLQSLVVPARGIHLGYTPAGRLRVLGLNEDYCAADLVKLSFRVDQLLHLSGRGVDDQIVARLDGLNDVTDLSVRGTRITEKGFRAFSVCGRLTQLSTEENEHIDAGDVKRLVAKLPNCTWLHRDTMRSARNSR